MRKVDAIFLAENREVVSEAQAEDRVRRRQ